MVLKQRIPALMAGILLIGWTISVFAQGGDTYKTRLAPAPALRGVVTGGTAAVAGVGNVTATLSGRKLTVNGTFEGLASAATVAKLYMGPVKGARDTAAKVLTEFAVTKGAEGKTGTIAGSFDLTPGQVDGLKKGQLYIQLHSEGVPSGHLLGWLSK